jgi:hypothetical protein
LFSNNEILDFHHNTAKRKKLQALHNCRVFSLVLFWDTQLAIVIKRQEMIPCPLCGVSFPLEKIEAHADKCTGAQCADNTGSSLNSGAFYYDVDNDVDVQMV